jgi:hypothetical protein
MREGLPPNSVEHFHHPTADWVLSGHLILGAVDLPDVAGALLLCGAAMFGKAPFLL